MTLQTYDKFPSLEIKYLGPPLDEGPLPMVIYFSLCATESLLNDPYHQPTQFFPKEFRTVSITLPGHGEGFDKFKAMQYWADHLEELVTFIEKTHQLIDHFKEKNWILPNKLGVMGLSRGAFIASHLAAHPEVNALLGFAPVSNLEALNEFKDHPNQKIIQALSLDHQLENLKNKHIRYYIGNRDERVQTTAAFAFTQKLVHLAYNSRIRSPQVELYITPSVGQLGHGTLPHIFEAGAGWLKKQIVI